MRPQDTGTVPTEIDPHRTRAFLRQASAKGAAMMLCDESVVDRARRKEAIVAAARADRFRVLVGQGDPASVGRPFTTLARLLAPLQPEFGRLEPFHRAALINLTERDRDPDTDVVSAAVRKLLRVVCNDRPILVVVDDLRWIDAGSAQILAAVARSLIGMRLGLLACVDRGSMDSAEAPMPAALKDAPWVAAQGWSAPPARTPKGHGDKFGLGSLTPQQRKVALLAASGLTNRAIADYLFVSHRTISAHLRAVFPKLGVATRASLRDALATEPNARRSMPAPADSVVGIKPRELEVAMLAATGLTNKQIADRLYLSHRTVGANLYRVFPKLGISTRAALRDALASLPIMDGRHADHRRITSVMSA
jgi:DNA-binding NarL/FixJ family response regulator